jgi:hypothetical protein
MTICFSLLALRRSAGEFEHRDGWRRSGRLAVRGECGANSDKMAHRLMPDHFPALR